MALASLGGPRSTDAHTIAAAQRGTQWLIEAARDEPPLASPLGLYFARLWYYEELYPLIFALEGLRECRSRNFSGPPRSVESDIQVKPDETAEMRLHTPLLPEVWDLVSNADHGDRGVGAAGAAARSGVLQPLLRDRADDRRRRLEVGILCATGGAGRSRLCTAAAARLRLRTIPAESGFGTDPAGWGWSMIAHYQGPEALRLISRPDKVFYLGFAMIASAIVSLITWNTLLLDRRDRIVLGPLPLPAAAVVLAKLAALLGYIGLVALAMHALASVAFGVALAANNTIIFAFRGIAAHLIASVAASLFVMLAVVALQGLTLALLAPRWFARVSPALQLAVVCLVITGVLTLPALTQSVNGAVTTAGGPDAWILATPPLWFLGLYERVLGTTNPALLGLSRTAQVAMALVSVTAIASFLVASGRAHVANTGRHVIQVRRSAVAIRALATAMGRDPQFQAAARFVLTTIARSHRHRLVMASAIGAATAWGLPAWISLSGRSEAPQLALLSSVLAVPLFLLIGLVVSAWMPIELKAAWAFELGSIPRWTARLVLERTMVVFAIAPPVLVFSLIYWWLWGIQAAALHALFALAAGTLLVQALLWNGNGVPCTRPWNRETLRLRHSWPAYLAVLLTLAPGLAGVELLLLPRPIACVCAAAYMFALAYHVRVNSFARPPALSAEPVDVLTSALRAARLSPGTHQDGPQAPALIETNALGNQVEPFTVHDMLAGLRPSDLIRDLRFGFRRLVGAPVFTLFSIVTLGCGVGITTGFYSIVHTALWTTPPVADIDRLVTLWAADGRTRAAFSLPDLEDFRGRQRTLSGLAATTGFQVPLVGGHVAEVVFGEAVNGAFFQTFGLRPHLGRLIHPGDDVSGALPVAVLSHDVWRLRFDSDPAAVGRSIRVDGNVYEVIGVAPDGFHGWDFNNLARVPAVWVPFASAPPEVAGRIRRADRNSHWIAVKGRLAPDRTIEQATAELSAIGLALEAEFPTPGSDPALGSRSRFGRRWFARAYDGLDHANAGLIGEMFIGAVALVLLIGCTEPRQPGDRPRLVPRARACCPSCARRLTRRPRARTVRREHARRRCRRAARRADHQNRDDVGLSGDSGGRGPLPAARAAASRVGPGVRRPGRTRCSGNVRRVAGVAAHADAGAGGAVDRRRLDSASLAHPPAADRMAGCRLCRTLPRRRRLHQRHRRQRAARYGRRRRADRDRRRRFRHESL